MKIVKNERFEKAKTLFPGGVNSPVRAFKSVGGEPVFFDRGKGAYLFDTEGNTYIDYVGAWGPAILGHAHPIVIDQIKKTLEKGLGFGAPHELEILLAEKIRTFMPELEQLRFVNSGTEATMSAIRLARAYTQRDKIIKFNGCYHGHSDSLLVKAGSGALTLGIPNSPGIPKDFAQHTLVAEYNDLDSVEKLLSAFPKDIAAIIIEPIAGNMNCILPQPGFLEGLRALCDHHQTLLIFDEVMTGFRVARGGASSLFHLQPDLITLGKIIGGGLPVGAFGGKKKIMSWIAPEGPVYQAGTLSGNPLAMAAGLATLEVLDAPDIYEMLSAKTQLLTNGLCEVAKQNSIPFCAHAIGGMFGIFFAESIPTSYEEATHCHLDRFKYFFHGMLKRGIYLAPSMFEAGFISLAHSKEDIDKTIEAAEQIWKH